MGLDDGIVRKTVRNFQYFGVVLNPKKMANEFKPTVGGKVSKADADKWMKDFDNQYRPDKKKDTKSVFFGRDIIEKILSDQTCTGISFFLALKDNATLGKKTINLVMIGTQLDGKLLNGIAASSSVMDDGDTTSNGGITCPDDCPTP